MVPGHRQARGVIIRESSILQEIALTRAAQLARFVTAHPHQPTACDSLKKRRTRRGNQVWPLLLSMLLFGRYFSLSRVLDSPRMCTISAHFFPLFRCPLFSFRCDCACHRIKTSRQLEHHDALLERSLLMIALDFVTEQREGLSYAVSATARMTSLVGTSATPGCCTWQAINRANSREASFGRADLADTGAAPLGTFFIRCRPVFRLSISLLSARP